MRKLVILSAFIMPILVINAIVYAATIDIDIVEITSEGGPAGECNSQSFSFTPGTNTAYLEADVSATGGGGWHQCKFFITMTESPGEPYGVIIDMTNVQKSAAGANIRHQEWHHSPGYSGWSVAGSSRKFCHGEAGTDWAGYGCDITTTNFITSPNSHLILNIFNLSFGTALTLSMDIAFTVLYTPTLPNQNPVAVGNAFITEKNTTINSNNILANDYDPQGENIIWNAWGNTDNFSGTIDLFSISNSAVFTYIPPTDWVGTVEIDYNIRDDSGNISNDATITIVIEDDTPPPTAPPGSGGGSGDYFGGCYVCESPIGFNLSEWIVWLYCKINNLFFCTLYNWISWLLNAILSIPNLFNNFVSWLFSSVQDGINWLVSWLQAAINYIFLAWSYLSSGLVDIANMILTSLMSSPLVDFIYSALAYIGITPDLVFTFFDNIKNVILSSFQIILVVVEIFGDVFSEVFNAFSAEGETATIAGISEATISELQQPGYSSTKVFWITMAAVRTFDTIWGSIPLYQLLTSIIIGIFSLFLIAWTMDKWNEILNF